MFETHRETRLLIPSLAGFYTSWGEISYALLRVVLGYILFMHGWGKVMGPGMGGVTAMMGRTGLEPAMIFAGAAIFLETVGAICVAFGLFTRFFAAALAIEMAIAMFSTHFAKGFSASKGGYEYVLLLGIALFAIAIRGGGRYSVDAMLGKEL